MRIVGGGSGFLDLLDQLLRSWWTIVAGLAAGTLITFVVLQQLPRQYVTTARVEFAEADNDLASARRLKHLLLDAQTAAHARIEIDGQTSADAVGTLGDRLVVEPATEPRTFDVRLGLDDPQLAAALVNGLVGAGANLPRPPSPDRAAELSALEDEIRASRDLIGASEQELADSRSRRLEQLADQRQENQDLLERRLAERAANQRAIARVREQLSQPTSDRLDQASPLARLLALELDLDLLLEQPGPDSRRVTEIRSALEALLVAHRPRRGNSDSKETALEEVRQARSRADELNRKVKALEREQRRIERETADYRARLQAATGIEHDQGNLEQAHQQLLAEHALLEQRLARLRRASPANEQTIDSPITLLSAATVPTRRVGPPVGLVIGLAFTIGLGLFVGPRAARELALCRVGSEQMLGSVSPVPVLVSIPPLGTRRQHSVCCRARMKNISLAAVSTGLCLALTLLVLWG